MHSPVANAQTVQQQLANKFMEVWNRNNLTPKSYQETLNTLTLPTLPKTGKNVKLSSQR